jgi:hypothetical protein
MMSKINQKLIKILLFLAAIVLCGCQPGMFPNEQNASRGTASAHVATLTLTPVQTPDIPDIIATPTATHTPPPLDIGPSNFPANVNPLTGLPVSEPDHLERRPMAIKISNDPRPIRPQWGLSLADIVYEYYTEWGKTRFAAIFYGNNAQQVGPIRSARFFDEHIILMYKAILAFVGADERVLKPFFKSEFSDLLVTEWPNGCPPICRVDEKMWSHAVSNTKILSNFITKQGIENGRQNLDGMGFTQMPPPEGKPANKIFIRFSPYFYPRWKYDRSLNKYVRYQDKEDDLGQGESYELLKDRLTDQPITADNVVVILVRYDEVVNEGNTQVFEVYLWNLGPAYLFRDGQMYRLHWERMVEESVLTVYNEDNYPFPLKPGNTWFEVLGLNSSISQPGDGTYRFEFAVP